MEVRLIENKDWIIIIILIIIVLLAIINTKYTRKFSTFIQLPVTNKYFNTDGKNNTINHPFSLLLFIIQTISISLFICVALPFIPNETFKNSPLLFIQVFSAYTLMVLGKYYLEKLVAHIFNIEKIVQEYLFEKISYMNLFSIFILILSIVYYFIFIPDVFVIFYSVIGFILIYFIALISSLRKNSTLILRHFFYFILYLCALEFAPYVILYKLVV